MVYFHLFCSVSEQFEVPADKYQGHTGIAAFTAHAPHWHKRLLNNDPGQWVSTPREVLSKTKSLRASMVQSSKRSLPFHPIGAHLLNRVHRLYHTNFVLSKQRTAGHTNFPNSLIIVSSSNSRNNVTFSPIFRCSWEIPPCIRDMWCKGYYANDIIVKVVCPEGIHKKCCLTPSIVKTGTGGVVL